MTADFHKPVLIDSGFRINPRGFVRGSVKKTVLVTQERLQGKRVPSISGVLLLGVTPSSSDHLSGGREVTRSVKRQLEYIVRRKDHRDPRIIHCYAWAVIEDRITIDVPRRIWTVFVIIIIIIIIIIIRLDWTFVERGRRRCLLGPVIESEIDHHFKKHFSYLIDYNVPQWRPTTARFGRRPTPSCCSKRVV